MPTIRPNRTGWKADFIWTATAAAEFVQSLAKPASPASAAPKIFRRPANRLPYVRLTKSSQALNSDAGELLENAGTCRGTTL
jgi:hypothetical protein